jgi:hypothetical protein
MSIDRRSWVGALGPVPTVTALGPVGRTPRPGLGYSTSRWRPADRPTRASRGVVQQGGGWPETGAFHSSRRNDVQPELFRR